MDSYFKYHNKHTHTSLTSVKGTLFYIGGVL